MEEEIKTQVEKIKDISEEIEADSGKAEQPLSEAIEEVRAEIEAEEKASAKEPKPFAEWPIIRWFINSSSAGKLIGKSFLLLVIPYICLFVLSAIFGNSSVREYGNSPIIILCVSGILLAINITLMVWSIIRFRKNRKG